MPKLSIKFSNRSHLRICLHKRTFCRQSDPNNNHWQSILSSWNLLTFCSRKSSAGQSSQILTTESVIHNIRRLMFKKLSKIHIISNSGRFNYISFHTYQLSFQSEFSKHCEIDQRSSCCKCCQTVNFIEIMSTFYHSANRLLVLFINARNVDCFM